ncbi:MAG: ABC transporter substrate-binding protein [Nocardioidaceae bacterium]|nr:MAG: ABC transporter substrate-binding protein [Nocardioidaceae bacterium]
MKGKNLALVMTAGMVMAVVSACGNGGSSDATTDASSEYVCSNPNADTMTDISITGMPILSNSVLFAGADEGIFEKHGLKPKFEMVASPAASVSSLAGGNSDFAWVTTINLLQAIEQGQKIRAVAPHAGVEPGFYDKMAAGEAGYERGINALLVPDGSDIKEPADLAGKNVAVADPAFSQVLASSFIDMHGGNSQDVNFVIMAPADAYAALLANKVDAAHSIEPFTMSYEDDGLRNLGWLEVENFKEGALMSFMVASEDYVAGNADTVERLRCAMAEVTEFGNTHHDELRAVTAREQKTEPDAFDNSLVPYFFTSLENGNLDQVQNLMVKYGLLKAALPMEDFLTPNVMKDASE